MTLGESIRAIRKKRGLTQKELGELCGINEAQIRRYELGGKNSKPKIDTIRKIAAALNEPLWSFVAPTEDNGYTDDDWSKDVDASLNEISLYRNVFKKYLNRNDGEDILTIISYYDILDDHGKFIVREILRSLPLLNSDGLSEASKRVGELTCIKSYENPNLE